MDRLPTGLRTLPAKMIRHASEMGETRLRDVIKNRQIAVAAGDEELAASALLQLLALPAFYTRGRALQIFARTVPAILRYDLVTRTRQVLDTALSDDPKCAPIVQDMRRKLDEACSKAASPQAPAAPAMQNSSTIGTWSSWYAWRPVRLLEAERRVWLQHVMRRRVPSIAGSPPLWEYTKVPDRFPARLTGADLLAKWSRAESN